MPFGDPQLAELLKSLSQNPPPQPPMQQPDPAGMGLLRAMSSIPVASAQTSVFDQQPASRPQPVAALPRMRGETDESYFQRQAGRILSKGGSTNDVVNFLKQSGYNVPGEVMTASTRVPLRTRGGNDLQGGGPGVKLTTPEGQSPSYLAGLSLSLLDGATFSFGDEAVGRIVGLVTGNGTQARDAYRQTLRAFAEQHPVVSTAAELAGGVGGTLLGGEALGALGGAGKIAALASKADKLGALGRIGLSAAEGATAGGIAGAGSADGTLSDRAQAALIGGLAGAVLAGGGTAAIKTLGAGPGAGAAVGAGLGYMKGGMIGAPIGLIAGGLTGEVGSRVFGRASEVLTTVAENHPNWARVVMGMDPGRGSLPLQARALVRASMDHNGISPDAAIAKTQQLRAAGVPATLADVTGPATLTLLTDVARGQRSPAVQGMVDALGSAQAQGGTRVMARLFNSLNLGTSNAYSAGERIIADRAALSRPYYERSYQQEVQVTPEIRKAFDNPLVQQAWNVGRATALAEDAAGRGHGLPIPALDIVEPKGGAFNLSPEQSQSLMQQAGGDLERFKQLARALVPSENPTIGNQSLPIRGLDYMKNALDDLIRSKGLQSDTGGNKAILSRRYGSAVQAQLSDLLDNIGVQVPDYSTARSIWKDNTTALGALALGKGGRVKLGAVSQSTGRAQFERSAGQRFIDKPPELIARELAGQTTDIQKEMYRVGALQDLAERIASVQAKGPDAVQLVFGADLSRLTPMMRRVEALFDDKASAQHVMDSIRGELTVAGKSGVVARSPVGRASEELQQSQSDIPLGPMGFRTGPASMAVRIISIRDRRDYLHAISNELSALGMRGLNSHDDLIALLESLKNVDTPHLPGIGLTTGAMAGRGINAR